MSSLLYSEVFSYPYTNLVYFLLYSDQRVNHFFYDTVLELFKLRTFCLIGVRNDQNIIDDYLSI